MLTLVAAAAGLVALPPVALADTPRLQVAPLQYTDNLNSNTVRTGFIDVSNPTDAPIHLSSSVKGFRQTGTNGDLQFYDDPDLTSGIKVDLTSFDLGPREAVRVLFSVDPTKLPRGGVYAAIFFRTSPTNQASTSSDSFVVQSANVGTLLILTNGGPGAHRGSITKLSLPFWQFGTGLHGGLNYRNTDTSQVAVAFIPALSSSVLPWGHATKLTTGLVLPGVTRRFGLDRPGSYLGLLPVTISDAATGNHSTVWVFACTGASWWVLLLILVLALLIVSRRLWGFPPLPRLVRKRAGKPVKHEPDPAPEPDPDPVAETPITDEPVAPEGPAEADAPEDAAAPPAEPAAPEPLPAANPAITKLIVKAEAAAPDPGTVIEPEPKEPAEHPDKSKPVHKIDVKSVKPAPKKSAHKVKVQPQDKPGRPRKTRAK